MSKHILIVDDDEFLTSMYQLSLAKEHALITVAHDGEQAIAMLDKDQPDLLILDLLMPKVDGFSVLQHVKQKGYKFPVIILSNLKGEMDLKKCMDLGAKDFYCKSDTDLEALAEKVRKHLK